MPRWEDFTFPPQPGPLYTVRLDSRVMRELEQQQDRVTSQKHRSFSVDPMFQLDFAGRWTPSPFRPLLHLKGRG